MSIGNICAIGKKGNGSSSGFYLNIINIPNTTEGGYPTWIAFLSLIEINNYNDLINVVDLYAGYNQDVILVAGEYINGSTRYHPEVVTRAADNTLFLRYKVTSTQQYVVTLVSAGGTPTNWTYTNIPL